MTFLPIVERELRVASRRPGTYRVRLYTTAIAIVVTLFFLMFARQVRPASLGANLFATLANYAYLLCSLCGVFITADALSEEKREGTLGLLFLTDLRGYDVVLGKLVARSVNAFYGLIALTPVLSVALLFGGVTPQEFCRVMLALVNAMFFSLTLAMLVSAFCREAQRAASLSFLLILLISIVMPLLDWLLDRMMPLSVFRDLTVASPGGVLSAAKDNAYFFRPGKFWRLLGISHLIGWVFLATTSWVLPRTWQDRPQRNRSQATGRAPTPQNAARNVRRGRKRAKLLDANPVLWLVSKHATEGILVWTLMGINAALMFAFRWFGLGWDMIAFCAMGTGFVLKVMLAVQACRFFVDARRNGSIEMLLSTPLTGAEILRGQWLALRQMFLWPFLLVIAEVLISGLMQVRDFPASTFKHGLYLIRLVLDPIAVTWFGMWLALTVKRPTLAPGLCVLFVLILPPIFFCVPDLLIDGVLIGWAYWKLSGNVRGLLVKQFAGEVSGTILPPPQPPKPPKPAPPVIGRT